MKIRFAFLLMMVGLIGTVSSCTQRSLSALNPCTINGVVQNVPVNPQRELDLLIVIDDSLSMRDEQAKLALQVPRLVSLLLTGGIDTDDSTPVGEFPAIENLHVGIVTPDLGHQTFDPVTNGPHTFTAGSDPSADFFPTNDCMRNGGKGKNGLMQVTGYRGEPRMMCTAMTVPPDTVYLNHPEPGFNAMDLVSDVACVTGQGTDGQWGCGFEQQLESILASDRNPANTGFNRDGALLAVILITDEDDCSTTDPRVFDVEARDSNPYKEPRNSMDQVQWNLRCSEHSGVLQDVQRYVDGIRALKSDPSQVVLAAITGIPEDPTLARDQFNLDEDRYAAILNHAEMQEMPDPNRKVDQVDQQLAPACTSTDIITSEESLAFPARRIVETMEGLAKDTSVGTVVESICADDFAPALNAIVDRIAAALRQLCLPRPLNRNSQGLVGCEVREVQPEGVQCDEARGRVAIEPEDGREVCQVTQLPTDPTAGVPGGLGWFYDDFTPETQETCGFNPTPQRVSFTANAEPATGARIRFECLQVAPPETEDVGWPCDDGNGADTICNPNPDNCLPGEAVTTAECELDPANCCETRILKERYDRDNLKLTCDPDSNTCQLTCQTNVQCPGGFACHDESDDGKRYCVNPTCTIN